MTKIIAGFTVTLAAIIATPIQMCVTNVEIHLTLKSLKKKSEVEELYLRLCHFRIIFNNMLS